MKVLHISHFRDGSGWSKAAQNQILALDSVGVEVVPRCVKFTSKPPGEIPARVLELEKRSAKGCDVVIQNVLPSVMERIGTARHIAYYFAEADRLPQGWADNINLLDESWVPNPGAIEVGRSSGVTHPQVYIPCSTDVSRFQQSYEPHKIRHEMPQSFFFYTIGEGHRKNLPALVRAFHLAFTPDEPVELIIKTSLPGMSPKESKNTVEGVLAKIKHDMGLYASEAHYKREIVMTDNLSEHEMMRLHATGDCFVTASYGEGFNLCALDAMAMGNTPIFTEVDGHQAFLDDSVGYGVWGEIEPVFGLNDGFYNSRQNWMSVDIIQLADTMRHVYENRNTPERKARALAGMDHVYDFSHQTVGNLMKNAFGVEQGSL